ncbi:DNA-processing protein DprA [Antrihabitans sp. NCIMB 15449]
MAACGARLVTPDDDEWAGSRLSALSESDDVPPLALWVRGPASLRAVTDRAVAVIGSRAPSEYGVTVAGEVSGDLAERKWTVVSGGAFGIDTAAHRAALAAGRVTVAVVPSGLDRAYPSANRELFDDIARTGLIISEFPPEFVPDRSSFAASARLTAALSAATLVVEAGFRSGSVVTARRARRLGRPVLAVPGPVTAATSTGCNQMIRDGDAQLVTRAVDVIDAIDASASR